MIHFHNTAIIQEEALIDIIQVLEYGFPLGPKFLYSLGSLVEAVTIHDKVYFDPLNYTKRDDLGGSDPHSMINKSDFIDTLIRSDALSPFPNKNEVDTYFKDNNIDYDMTEFLIDSTWALVSFADRDPDEEENDYKNLIDLLDIETIFEEWDFGLTRLDESTLSFTTPTVLLAFDKGFNARDLKIIESLNRRAASYVALSNKLEMNMYPTFVALPHQLGAVRSSNRKARELYESIIENILAMDDELVGKENYRRISIPPLLSIVLEKCKDKATAIGIEICELRNRHKVFRKYLTGYEKEWKLAKTRSDRLKLSQDFDNAWQELTKRYEAPPTRIIYQIWDVLKEPTKVLQKLGDKLAQKGKELSVISRAAGLHDFHQELLRSPIPERNFELVQKLFKRLIPDSSWKIAETYANRMDELIKNRGS